MRRNFGGSGGRKEEETGTIDNSNQQHMNIGNSNYSGSRHDVGISWRLTRIGLFGLGFIFLGLFLSFSRFQNKVSFFLLFYFSFIYSRIIYLLMPILIIIT